MNYLLVHFLISLLTPLLGAKGKTKTEYFTKFLLVVGFPVVGFIIVLIMFVMEKSNTKRLEDDDYEDPIILFTDKIDVAREVNILPIEELLNVKDLSMKRSQLINTLMEDFSSLIDKLKLALRDDDIETSHYAASAIAEIKRDLDKKLLAIGKLYQDSQNDLGVIEEYIEVLVLLIDSETYDQMSLLYFKETLINILEHRIDIATINEVRYYNMIIHYLIITNQRERAISYIIKHKELFYNEDSFIFEMELYYTNRDYQNFKRVYRELISSPVVLSNKGLGVVRFWMEGMNNGLA